MFCNPSIENYSGNGIPLSIELNSVSKFIYFLKDDTNGISDYGRGFGLDIDITFIDRL
jgi:hypothetical protein